MQWPTTEHHEPSDHKGQLQRPQGRDHPSCTEALGKLRSGGHRTCFMGDRDLDARFAARRGSGCGSLHCQRVSPSKATSRLRWGCVSSRSRRHPSVRSRGSACPQLTGKASMRKPTPVGAVLARRHVPGEVVEAGEGAAGAHRVKITAPAQRFKPARDAPDSREPVAAALAVQRKKVRTTDSAALSRLHVCTRAWSWMAPCRTSRCCGNSIQAWSDTGPGEVRPARPAERGQEPDPRGSWPRSAGFSVARQCTHRPQ